MPNVRYFNQIMSDIALNKNILLVLFSPGSAETDVWCDGNINGHLMASCV